MFVTCNYAKEGERYGLNITMLFDTETFTIYELNIDTTYLSDSGTENEIPQYLVDNASCDRAFPTEKHTGAGRVNLANGKAGKKAA